MKITDNKKEQNMYKKEILKAAQTAQMLPYESNNRNGKPKCHGNCLTCDCFELCQ